MIGIILFIISEIFAFLSPPEEEAWKSLATTHQWTHDWERWTSGTNGSGGHKHRSGYQRTTPRALYYQQKWDVTPEKQRNILNTNCLLDSCTKPGWE